MPSPVPSPYFFLYEKNHEAANAVAAQTGATAICCDVADGEAVKKAFSQIGTVDILVNNAGIYIGGLINLMSSQDWDRLFDVNVKGIFHCVTAAMSSFLETHSGCIINISSMWGQVGASCESAYSATKGAVIALTKALAKELGPSGIRVNAIAPGVILTDMCAGYPDEVLEGLKEETPVGRNGTGADIAQAALYLAEAEFVTGQILGVNGGFVI